MHDKGKPGVYISLELTWDKKYIPKSKDKMYLAHTMYWVGGIALDF